MSTLTTTCSECGFTSSDYKLAERHSCDVQQQGGFCEDFPACGHEAGDCNGLLYGSDDAIKQRVYDDILSGHGECSHEEGMYNCESDDLAESDEDFDEDDVVLGSRLYA